MKRILNSLDKAFNKLVDMFLAREMRFLINELAAPASEITLRSALNTLNTAFDEDTQKGTDRLIRGILQDLTELETSNAQKEGIERSPRRVANLNAKLDKLQCAFNDFLAFAG